MSRFGARASRDARAAAASAWAFRWRVEREAELRFQTLALRMESLGARSHLAALARRAADDERRHAAHCARLAAELGEDLRGAAPPSLVPVAPSSLGEEDAVTYELVAACCVAETVSVAVLTRLLASAPDDALRPVLRELARDEVTHARLGWASVTVAAARGRTAFLGPLVPSMLAGSVDDDFRDASQHEPEDDEILSLGVLPPATKRGLFLRTVDGVVLPGLEAAGIDVTAARGWLAAHAEAVPAQGLAAP